MNNLCWPNKPCSKKRVCACAWEKPLLGERSRCRGATHFQTDCPSLKLWWVLNFVFIKYKWIKQSFRMFYFRTQYIWYKWHCILQNNSEFTPVTLLMSCWHYNNLVLLILISQMCDGMYIVCDNILIAILTMWGLTLWYGHNDMTWGWVNYQYIFIWKWTNPLMIRFNRNDSLINSDLLPPTGGFNFTFKVSFYLNNSKYQYSTF